MKYVKCKDKFLKEIKDGDFLDVQEDGLHQVYRKKDGQLYFKPYGKEDRLSAYFSNDIVLHKRKEIKINISSTNQMAQIVIH